jgi:hypothetical protein
VNICKCGKPAIKSRKVCNKCLYQSQAEYRQQKAEKIAKYQIDYRKDNAERLRKYNREYMRKKRAGRRPADIMARRPWHEQEAMKL